MGSDETRITRLVGNREEGGGGIPLPPVFGKILEELADDKVATFAELSKVVSTALEYKKARVFVTWRNWKSVTADFLAQLEAEGFITQPEGGFYRRTQKVKPGAGLLVIPEKDIRVTVYDAKQGALLDKISAMRSEVTASGLLNKDMDQLLTQMTGAVDGKVTKREFHAGSIVPLDDEPGIFRMCTRCRKDFELTDENFSQFKSHGEYYRQRQHVQCRKESDAELAADKRRALQVKRDMIYVIGDGLSLAEIMARFGLDDYLARKYWDELAALGKVPYRDRAWK